jgi:hypothetical protein
MIFFRENVMGFLIKRQYPGSQWMTGPEFLRQKLGAEYHISEVIIDLTPWVFMQRPRVWIFGSRESIETREMVLRAVTLVTEMLDDKKRFIPTFSRTSFINPSLAPIMMPCHGWLVDDGPVVRRHIREAMSLNSDGSVSATRQMPRCTPADFQGTTSAL